MNFDDILEEGFSIVAEEINVKDIVDSKEDKSQTAFPILAVRNMVMFPHIIVPITAGRNASIQLLEDAQKNNQLIGIVSQNNPMIETPTEKDLYKVGVLAKIIKIVRLPEGNITVITKGFGKFKIKKMMATEPYFIAEITKQKDTQPQNKEEFDAMMENIVQISESIISLDPSIPNGAKVALKNFNHHEELLSFIALNANFSYK